MKKLTVGLLVLALVITLFPASVLAADAVRIGNTSYATLEDAVNAAKSGDTITLGEGNTPCTRRARQCRARRARI